MYAADMSLGQALAAKAALKAQDKATNHASNTIAWDIDDVQRRIDELTDWY
jgi:hypothetical protein